MNVDVYAKPTEGHWLSFGGHGCRTPKGRQIEDQAWSGVKAVPGDEAYLFQKQIRQGFGYTNVDHCTWLCHGSAVVALLESVCSETVTANIIGVAYADLLILFGDEPVEPNATITTCVNPFSARGGKLTVMDCRGVGHGRIVVLMPMFLPCADVSMLSVIIATLANRLCLGWTYSCPREIRAEMK